nr:dnaJ domain containing protein 4 [Dermatophagoides farinae]
MSKKGGSLRHVVHRRVHLERNADPSKTKKFAQEKKDDFLRRIKAVNKKKEYLIALAKKTAKKNPNEFKFAMINQRLVKNKVIQLSKDNPEFNAKLLSNLEQFEKPKKEKKKARKGK